MSISHDDDLAPLKIPPRIEELKSQARTLGIVHSNNIGVDALQAKIDAHRAALDAGQDPTGPKPGVDAAAPAPVVPKKSLRQRLVDEATKLVRIRITCMNPDKKQVPGEIITVANEYIGTVRKYVPYGAKTNNGYHVPYCIYEFLKNRMFLSQTLEKDPVTNIESTVKKLAREFSIEVLPALTPRELAKLENAQRAAGNDVDDVAEAVDEEADEAVTL